MIPRRILATCVLLAVAGVVSPRQRIRQMRRRESPRRHRLPSERARGKPNAYVRKSGPPRRLGEGIR